MKLKDKENKDTYATLFFQTYNQSNGLNFVFLKSIFDFIITGYLDKELLKQELNQIYNKYSEEEKAYRKLQDFLYLEEKEGKELVFKIIEYLNSGKFHLAIILKLYSSFKLIQERGYIENFNHKKYYVEKNISCIQSVNFHCKKIHYEILNCLYIYFILIYIL